MQVSKEMKVSHMACLDIAFQGRVPVGFLSEPLNMECQFRIYLNTPNFSPLRYITRTFAAVYSIRIWKVIAQTCASNYLVKLLITFIKVMPASRGLQYIVEVVMMASPNLTCANNYYIHMAW